MFTRRVAHDMDPPNRMATSVSRFPAGHPHWVRRQFPLMCTPGTRRVADHTLKNMDVQLASSWRSRVPAGMQRKLDSSLTVGSRDYYLPTSHFNVHLSPPTLYHPPTHPTTLLQLASSAPPSYREGILFTFLIQELFAGDCRAQTNSGYGWEGWLKKMRKREGWSRGRDTRSGGFSR